MGKVIVSPPLDTDVQTLKIRINRAWIASKVIKLYGNPAFNKETEIENFPVNELFYSFQRTC